MGLKNILSFRGTRNLLDICTDAGQMSPIVEMTYKNEHWI